jgi:hypothetical protein
VAVPVFHQCSQEFGAVLEVPVKAAFAYRHRLEQRVKAELAFATFGHCINGKFQPLFPAKLSFVI